MIIEEIINWLLQSDVSVQYQVNRDLAGIEKKDLQARILSEGWGAQFLSFRKENKHWGRGFYQPKWISSHYTLLDLKHLNPIAEYPLIKETVDLIFDNNRSEDGGLNPAKTIKQSDVCVNGMALNYACYFKISQEKLKSVIDFILLQQLNDGGFNCMYNRSGAVHSSLHSSLSVCEGILEYKKNGYSYRLEELMKVKNEAEEFILKHRLYLSDRTGKIINKAFLKLTYPGRWRYDILKALDYFRSAKIPFDDRMQPALDVLLKKRRKDGLWNIQAKHSGQVHFDMEESGKESRWNTLRALRVLKYFGFEHLV